MTVSIVIPNWNGRNLLEKNLPFVLRIGADEVIVVDDGSPDDSVTVVRKFQMTNSKLQIIENKENLGFVRSVNRGVQEATGDVVILLNTDVKPKSGLIEAIAPHFKNPDVFAVSFNEGKYGWAAGVFHRGLVEHRPGDAAKEAHVTFWASGGSAAFDKKKWESLGGMDSIYTPFYWEDIDISYRAQKQGWKVLWEPKAKVEHDHEATIGRFFDERRKNWIAERNQLLFFWLNITSVKMWLFHFLWLPIRLLRPGWWIPFLLALLRLPRVFIRRLQRHGMRGLSDEQIIAKFN